ncbi:277_t:CDS:1, partial [Gigaspora rosea]
DYNHQEFSSKTKQTESSTYNKDTTTNPLRTYGRNHQTTMKESTEPYRRIHTEENNEKTTKKTTRN